MEEFQHYKRDKWYWFYAYLQLGQLICENPHLSVKNSDFSLLLEDYNKREYITSNIIWDK